MQPEQAAKESAEAVSVVGGAFMSAPDTYGTGGALGFQGIDFYVAGRGGVLGDAPADVVVAAFVFFDPDSVRAHWASSRPVMSRAEAADAWARACHAWGEATLADSDETARLAELAGRVSAAADPAGAPLFAGWRALAEPEAGRPRALAAHRMNGLRELRGALHGAAVLAHGLRPVQAVHVRSPQMAQVLGWSEPVEDADGHRAAWQQAEDATNRMFGRALGALDADERAEFVALATKARAALPR